MRRKKRTKERDRRKWYGDTSVSLWPYTFWFIFFLFFTCTGWRCCQDRRLHDRSYSNIIRQRCCRDSFEVCTTDRRKTSISLKEISSPDREVSKYHKRQRPAQWLYIDHQHVGRGKVSIHIFSFFFFFRSFSYEVSQTKSYLLSTKVPEGGCKFLRRFHHIFPITKSLP